MNNQKAITKQITICIIICALLCLVAGFAIRKADRNKSVGISVHMTEFNKDLQRNSPYDDCRTTYEIFVYSFCDSNGDGIGDLNGVRSKLDYISDIGFDAIWLTPIHPSATYHKYDVDDYYEVDPSLGSMKDFEALLADCHARGIRVYMDMVFNHTSEDHSWFRAASDYLHELPYDWEPDLSYCKYFDYYNFRRVPAEGFTQLEGTGWYYESRFWSEMPELNLDSEFVKDEIRNIMQFWLSKGVDGFRLDAVTSYFYEQTDKNAEFLRFLEETARNISPDCYIVGEAWTDRDSIAALYSSGVDSLFDFPFAGGDGVIARTLNGSCTAYDFVQEMIKSEAACAGAGTDCIDAPFYTNHDMDRSTAYYPDDDGSAAKMAYAMSLLMTGNSFVYYGEEIGMDGAGRDENRRAPMYWSDGAGSGMCQAPPGMDALQMRYPPAEEQKDDELSLHRWFSEVIKVRNAFPAIVRGRTECADVLCDDRTAAFFRRSETYGNLLIVMNLSEQTTEKSLNEQLNDNDLSAQENNKNPYAQKTNDGQTQAGTVLRLAAVLNSGEERIEYKDSTLSLPPYSIAVFTME